VKEKQDSTFVEILKSNIGKEVKLSVYNTRTEKIRGTFKLLDDELPKNAPSFQLPLGVVLALLVSLIEICR
jgi:hypothetical protein